MHVMTALFIFPLPAWVLYIDELTVNQNAALIQEKEKARRDDLKKQSEKDKERNKMLLDKQKQQKLDKDAENKKKSAKKERKRG
jgi:hypothetical protein